MSKQIVAGKISKCCGVAVYLEGRYGGTHEFEYCTKCRKRQDLQDASRETTTDGKVITKTEHPDGRKDVHIEVNSLNVKEDDPATLKAKEVIEKEVIPKLADALVLVVVIHKPTNEHAERIVKVPMVRKFAEAIITARGGEPSEYVIVEHHLTNGTVIVSTL